MSDWNHLYTDEDLDYKNTTTFSNVPPPVMKQQDNLQPQRNNRNQHIHHQPYLQQQYSRGFNPNDKNFQRNHTQHQANYTPQNYKDERNPTTKKRKLDSSNK